jgi:hypothetical protein
MSNLKGKDPNTTDFLLKEMTHQQISLTLKIELKGISSELPPTIKIWCELALKEAIPNYHLRYKYEVTYH